MDNGWMDGGIDKRMDGLMGRWMEELMKWMDNRWMDGGIHERVDGLMDKLEYRMTDERINERMNR